MPEQELSLLIHLRDEASAQLKQINREVATNSKTWKENYGAIAANVKQAGIALTAFGAVVTGAFGLMTKQFADTAESISLLSQKTGMSVEFLSGMKYAAEQTGTSVEALNTAFRQLNNVLASPEGRKYIDQLGLSLESLMKLNPEQRFLAIAQAISGLPDPAARAAAAMDVFGRSGVDLLPLITGDMEGLLAKAKELGLVMDTATVKSGTEFAQALKELEGAFEGLKTAIAPIITEFVTPFLGQVKDVINQVRTWSKANPELSKTIITITAAIGAFAAIVGPMLITIGTIAPAIAAAFSPVGLAIMGVIVLIGLTIAAFMNFWDYISNFSTRFANDIDWWKRRWQDFANLVIVTWQTVGNWLKGVWQDTMQALLSAWQALPAPFKVVAEAIRTIIEIILIPFQKLIDAIKWLLNIGRVTSPSAGGGRETFGPPASAGFAGGSGTALGDMPGQSAQQARESASEGGFGSGESGGGQGPFGGGESGGGGATESFAKGGIVTRPTRALIGEAGPEAIIPLNNSGMPFEIRINLTNEIDGEIINKNTMLRTGTAYYRRQRLGG